MGHLAARHRIVFDIPKQTIDVLTNGSPGLSVPFALVTSTRVQKHTSQGYADNFNVLVPLGVAELWIMQSGSCEHAQGVAGQLARAMGVGVDPEEQHKY